MFEKVREFVVRAAKIVWTLMAVLGIVVTIRFFWNNRIEVVQRETPNIVNSVNSALSVVSGPSDCSDLRTVTVKEGDTMWELIKEECNVSDSSVPDYLPYNTGKLVAGTTAQICCSVR